MVEFLAEEAVEDADAPKGTDLPGDDAPKGDEAPKDADAPKDGAPDNVEELASEIGWRPDGELNAKEYILKSRDIQDTMRTHIQDQKKQLTDLGSSVAELKTHNERVFKAEVSKLKTELTDLKKEKREAIEDGDADKVDELDEQIDGVKEAMAAPKTAKPSANPELTSWLQENTWYDTDPEMAKYADAIADQNTAAPYDRMLRMVETKVKDMFPDKFEAGATPGPGTPKARTPASPVEGSGKKTVGTTFTKADLTSDQKSIMSQFVRQGIMTEKAYIADIATTQGV